jgi:hypothetical protein
MRDLVDSVARESHLIKTPSRSGLASEEVRTMMRHILVVEAAGGGSCGNVPSV